MEDLAMTTLAKTSDNLFPSFFNRFFEGGDLTDWNARNFAGFYQSLVVCPIKLEKS